MSIQSNGIPERLQNMDFLQTLIHKADFAKRRQTFQPVFQPKSFEIVQAIAALSTQECVNKMREIVELHGAPEIEDLVELILNLHKTSSLQKEEEQRGLRSESLPPPTHPQLQKSNTQVSHGYSALHIPRNDPLKNSSLKREDSFSTKETGKRLEHESTDNYPNRQRPLPRNPPKLIPPPPDDDHKMCQSPFSAESNSTAEITSTNSSSSSLCFSPSGARTASRSFTSISSFSRLSSSSLIPNLPECISSFKKGIDLAHRVLITQYHFPQTMKKFLKEMEQNKVENPKKYIEMMIELYLDHQHRKRKWEKCVSDFMEVYSKKELDDFEFVMNAITNSIIASSAAPSQKNLDEKVEKIFKEYPFDSSENLRSLFEIASFTEKSCIYLFQTFSTKELEELRKLRVSELLAKALNWDLCKAMRRFGLEEPFSPIHLQSLVKKLGCLNIQNPLSENIGVELSRFCSHPLFKDDLCFELFLRRVSLLHPTTEDPIIRQVGQALLNIEIAAKQQHASLKETLCKTVSENWLSSIFFGSKNQALNLTQLKMGFWGYIPPVYCNDPTLKTQSAFKEWIDRAVAISNPQTLDANTQKVLEIATTLHSIIAGKEIDSLWGGLVLIYFNEEELALLFGTDCKDKPAELQRCIQIIAKHPIQK